MLQYLGLDEGSGAKKLWGAAGGVEVPAQAASAGPTPLAGNIAGLRAQKPPLHITLEAGAFYVGPAAHHWGRPVENLADERLSGSPETRALIYAAFTRYAQQYGVLEVPVHLTLGLSQLPLAESQAATTLKGVRWLEGKHTWEADGKPYHLEISGVTTTTQAAGALFDYLLDEVGAFVPERKPLFQREIGIVSVGMNTLELMVIQNGAPVPRFTRAETAGVRRLLELVDPAAHYSRGELDTLLRAGRLEVREALPIWGSEVLGHLERHWGTAYRRFGVVLVVGGGALLLRDTLLGRFNGKGFFPDLLVLSIARGLYKLALMREQRKRK